MVYKSIQIYLIYIAFINYFTFEKYFTLINNYKNLECALFSRKLLD